MSELSTLQNLSNSLSFAIEKAGVSVVRVDDGTRLTATGTVWSSDGIIVTTSHGVERDEDLTVELHTGATVKATVIGRDPESDIAVLQAEGTEFSPIEIGKGSNGVGSLVLAVGRPGNAGLQATFGIISSSREANGAHGKVFYTDATFYPGFSGGALVDAGGDFVGLLNLGWNRGRGVAIGAGVVQDVVTALVTHGRVQRGYLGIGTQPVELRRSGQTAGLLVISVDESSAADKAGVLVGDTILTVEGSAVADPHGLRRVLRGSAPGTRLKIEVLRAGDVKSIEAELGVRE
jgi:S1-C subfamily serine protease